MELKVPEGHDINRVNALTFTFLFSVVLVCSGAVDLDWQLMSYRYSEWHRNVDYWEYCPFIKINWWMAYMLNVLRVSVGCLILGFCLNEMRHNHGRSPL